MSPPHLPDLDSAVIQSSHEVLLPCDDTPDYSIMASYDMFAAARRNVPPTQASIQVTADRQIATHSQAPHTCDRALAPQVLPLLKCRLVPNKNTAISKRTEYAPSLAKR